MKNLAQRHSAWIWLCAALIVVAALKVLTTPTGAPAALGADNAQPNGALALNLWLQRSGHRVTSASSSDLGTRSIGSGGTLLVLAPGAQLRGATLNTALQWVRGGGALVAVVSWDRDESARRFGFRVAQSLDSPARIVQPLLLSPPVRRLSGSTSSALEGSGAGVVVARSAAGPALVMRRWGRGTVWLLTEPEVLDNGHIALGDNRRLALNLVGSTDRGVAFDEYSPPVAGNRAPTSWLTETAWGIAALFLLAVFLLYRFFSGWRLGPPVTPLADRHRPAVEYVVSMAGLLRRGHKRREVLRDYQARLERLASQGHSRQGAMLEDPAGPAELERLLAPHPGLDDGSLLQCVREIVECEEQLTRRTGV